jgi:threonine 3-dehydrogenase
MQAGRSSLPHGLSQDSGKIAHLPRGPVDRGGRTQHTDDRSHRMDKAMMKVLAKLERAPGLTMTRVKKPEIGHNDVMIRIRKTAICGTDIHIWKWDEWAQKTIPVPMHVGHEYVGEIVEIGQEVRGFKIGDRVSGEGHITCGFCRNCRAGRRHLCRNTTGVGVNREGAFAEYLVIPAFNAFRIPDDISDEMAAIFDPFGNATHTALSFNLVGEDVLITGAGPIGIMAAAIAKHVGARNVVITDVNDYRLELALKMGATRAINVTKTSLRDVMTELRMTEGFDVGMEMSGVPSAFVSMLEHMNHGGKVALLGIPPSNTAIDWNQVIFKGLEIKGIYGREMFETWYKMVAMLQSGLDLTPIITHRYPVDQFETGFAAMLSGQSGKVILDWSEAASPAVL